MSAHELAGYAFVRAEPCSSTYHARTSRQYAELSDSFRVALKPGATRNPEASRCAIWTRIDQLEVKSVQANYLDSE